MTYQLCSGRPYSDVEVFALRAVDEGISSVDRLVTFLALHPRVVLEALVTLTYAGWVGITAKGLGITPLGRVALSGSTAPRTRQVSTAEDAIVVERVTGALAASREVSPMPERLLGERGVMDGATKLRALAHVTELDAGQVTSILKRGSNEWIGAIERIVLERHEGYWLPARVRLETAEIFNVPDCWRHHLAPQILSAAGVRMERTKQAEGRWLVKQCRRTDAGLAGQLESSAKKVGGIVLWPECPGAGAALVTDDEHQDLLRRALGEARTLLVIGSAFIQGEATKRIAGAVAEAVCRGVTVVCLWGFGADDANSEAEALAHLRELESSLLGEKGRLLFNRRHLDTHLKVLFWDSGDASQCCIGSYNWLSTRSSTDGAGMMGRNVSFVTADSRCAASVLKAVVGVFARGGRLERTTTPSILNRAAEALEERATAETQEGTATWVGVVRDIEHHHLTQLMISCAVERLLIVSHQVGEAVHRLEALSSGPSFPSVVVRSGSVRDESVRKRLQALLGRVNGRFAIRAGLHAKVIVSDTLVYLGSFNPLSSDPHSTAAGVRELGLVIESRSLADALWAMRVD